MLEFKHGTEQNLPARWSKMNESMNGRENLKAGVWVSVVRVAVLPVSWHVSVCSSRQQQSGAQMHIHLSHSGVQHQSGISRMYLCMYARTVWLTTCLKCGKKIKCQDIGSVTTKWMARCEEMMKCNRWTMRCQLEFNHWKHLSCQNIKKWKKSWEQLKCRLRRKGWVQLKCQLKADQVLIHESHAAGAGLKLERNFWVNGWEWRGWSGQDWQNCQSWNIPLRWPLWGSGSSVPTRNNSAPSLLLTVHLLPCRHPFGYVPGLVPFPFFLFYSVHTHLTPLTHHLHSHAHHPLCSPTMCFLYVFNDSQSV